jgi:hypothetical protein
MAWVQVSIIKSLCAVCMENAKTYVEYDDYKICWHV